MRTLGILGGLAWPSTAHAYRAINEAFEHRTGGATGAQILVWSFDFTEIHALQEAGDWAGAEGRLSDAAGRLWAAGAEGLVICSNTMHRCAEAVTAAVPLPLIHIADATATVMGRERMTRVGLLATRYTMEQDFYVGRLRRHGFDVVLPEPRARDVVHEIIYGELVHGVVREESRDALRGIITWLESGGCQGIIAGCTEIELLLGQDDVRGGWFPTTAIHVEAAVDWMLGGDVPWAPEA